MCYSYLTIWVYIISIRFSSLKIGSLYFLIYNLYLHLKDAKRQRVLTKCPVKWSANRITTKAKQQEIANEVREKIIDHLKNCSQCKTWRANSVKMFLMLSGHTGHIRDDKVLLIIRRGGNTIPTRKSKYWVFYIQEFCGDWFWNRDLWGVVAVTGTRDGYYNIGNCFNDNFSLQRRSREKTVKW